MISITFIQASGEEKTIEAEEGSNLMTAAIENGVEGILGDCGGACACATCHCYIDDTHSATIPDADEIEQSMIEFAADPKENSRLGCQVTITREMSGLVVHLPESQI